MVAQGRDRDIMHLHSPRGEQIAWDTEAVGLRPQDRVVVEDQGLLHRMLHRVLIVTDVIRESAGW